LIGKLYRDDRCTAVYERMMALWCGGLRGKVQRPLHYFSALGLILHSPVAGQSLAEMVTTTATAVTLSNIIKTTAQNLALLHATPIIGLPTHRNMADHLAKFCHPHLHQLIDALAAEHSVLSRQAATIFDALTKTNILENVPLLTIHNNLTLPHIYWQSGNVVFIELDGLCRAHAELDLATFRVALRVKLGEQGKMLGDHFLKAYVNAGGETSVYSLQLYESLAYLRRAANCYRKRSTNKDWLQELTNLLESSLLALNY
jgi:aminoglycoside phosphotransferase